MQQDGAWASGAIITSRGRRLKGAQRLSIHTTLSQARLASAHAGAGEKISSRAGIGGSSPSTTRSSPSHGARVSPRAHLPARKPRLGPRLTKKKGATDFGGGTEPTRTRRRRRERLMVAPHAHAQIIRGQRNARTLPDMKPARGCAGYARISRTT